MIVSPVSVSTVGGCKFDWHEQISAVLKLQEKQHVYIIKINRSPSQKIMRYTRTKSLILSVAATLWLPASLILNAGWLTLMLMTPGWWVFDTVFLAPLLVPLLSILTRVKSISKEEARLQIIFYACWVLIGFFIVNSGDTEDSVHSIVTTLLGGVFGRQPLNVLSGYIAPVLFFLSLTLLAMVLVRIVGQSILNIEAKSPAAQKSSPYRLPLIGIIPGAFFSLASYMLGYLLSGTLQNDPPLSSSLSLAVPFLLASVVACYGLMQIKQSNALGVSLTGTALAALTTVISIPTSSERLGLLAIVSPYVAPVIVAPLALWVVGRLTSKAENMLVNIILIVVALGLSIFSTVQVYREAQQAIAKIAQGAQQAADAPIDFKLYEPTYLRGNPPVLRRHFYPGSNAELDVDYSSINSKSSELKDFVSFSIRERNATRVPTGLLGPGCGDVQGVPVPAKCILAGTSSNGARVFLVEGQATSFIYDIVITIGNTNISIEDGSYYRSPATEAMKIAEGLHEVTKKSQTIIEDGQASN